MAAKRKAQTRAKRVAASTPVELAPTPHVYTPPLAYRQAALSWYEFVATGFFSGYLPKAPGTWGSLYAALLFFLTARIFPNDGILFQVGWFSLSWWALVCAGLSTVVGVIASERLADEWREKDPGEIVIDEFAGVFFACALIQPSLASIIAAFVCFRIFDIFKPGPIARLQNLAGGRGIVFDDVLAGIFAAPFALALEVVFAKIFTVG